MLGEIGPSETFIEFVEVIIHNILYARKVYPDTIYSPRRKYGIPVFQCIQPDVNQYIAEALKAVSFHYKRNQLKQLLLCFDSEGSVVERYVFSVVDIKKFVNSDPLILKLEQYMRDFLLRLHSSLSYLNDLAESSTFSIRLEVTEYSSWEFNQDPNHEVKKKKFTKKKNPMIKLSEEVLSLQCGWKNCEEVHSSWEKFNAHLVEHATNQSENVCCWKGCEDTDLQTVPLLMQHMSHHGYISKLQNLGQNISKRNKLPSCKESHKFSIPVLPFGYKCEWEFCSFDFCTIYEFVDHMNIHIKNNPKRATAEETINCCWKACNTKYLTQTKLTEHIRIHTGEKVVGCPSCGRLFSNKTKFCDHRKRQLSTELQSYQCSQCLKLFPSERLLRDHMRSHVNHYKCTMCDMTCPKPSILAKHIRFKHIKFKPYKCPDCDKTFVEKYNLNTHLKTHEKQKPLKCSVCEFECRSRVGLENHYLKKHDGPGLTYQCHCCKKKFKRGTYLTKHLTKLHNFHWPSGHSRFRYRKDQDGIYRLQTVRYESLEVTQEMILSESMQTTAVKKTETYNLKYDNDGKSGYVLSISENGEQCVRHTEKKQDKNILITINDLDEDGNIMKCEIVESEIVESTILPANEITKLDTALNVVGNDDGQRCDERDSGDFETNAFKLENHVLNPEDEKDVGKMKGTILDYEIFKNN